MADRVVDPRTMAGYELVVEDAFAGTTLDDRLWLPYHRSPRNAATPRCTASSSCEPAPSTIPGAWWRCG
ncbi:MAG TPA: hypothetical protein VES42_23510 [Pilimelia sp.]|nr:hypothetical protein [Pilimelia sp.]